MNNATKTRVICLAICFALSTSVFFVSAKAAVVANPIDEVNQLNM